MNMEKMIQRLVKRAAGYEAMFGQYLVNQLLEGATGKSKGTWSRKATPPDDPELASVHQSLVDGKGTPLYGPALGKVERSLATYGKDPMDLVMGLYGSDWAYSTGKGNARAIMNGQFDLNKFGKFVSRKLTQMVKDIQRGENRRREIEREHAPIYEDEMRSQQSLPGGWARDWPELIAKHLFSNSREGKWFRKWLEANLRNLNSPNQVEVMTKIVEWMNENPSGNFDRMWSSVAKDKFNNTISRQNIKKTWDKAIKQLSGRVKSDKQFQEKLMDVSHELKAASLKLNAIEVQKVASGVDFGWSAVIELDFFLDGPRIASQDPGVDPRTILAGSPRTLNGILRAVAGDIELAVNAHHWELAHASIRDLVVNENLAHTWSASRVGSSNRFKMFVGVAGLWE
jgi:hypothetical protein